MVVEADAAFVCAHTEFVNDGHVPGDCKIVLYIGIEGEGGRGSDKATGIIAVGVRGGGRGGGGSGGVTGVGRGSRRGESIGGCGGGGGLGRCVRVSPHTGTEPCNEVCNGAGESTTLVYTTVE